MVTINLMGITIIVVLGIHILTGYCGMVTLGQAGFVAVGAYTSLILAMKLGFSFWEALPCAAIISGLVGVIFGLAVLRMRGFYLVIATLAAGILIPGIISTQILPAVNIASIGVLMPSYPTIGSISFDTQGKMWFIILLFIVVVTLITVNFARGRAGRAFCSIRDNTLAVETMGVNVSLYKLYAFFICCVFAGVGGSLYAYWMQVVSIEQFSYQESIIFLGAVVIGGLGSIAGALIGGAVIRSVGYLVSTQIVDRAVTIGYGAEESFLSSFITPQAVNLIITHGVGVFPLLVGLITVLFIVFVPQGLIQWWNKFRGSYRLWPLSQ